MDFTTFTTQITAFLHHSVITGLFIAPLCIILLDVITGVMSAVKKGTFKLKLLPTFLGKDCVWYLVIVGLIGVAYFFWGSATATSIGTAFGMTGLSIAIIDSILSNISEVFGAPIAALVGQELSQIGLPPYIPAAVVQSPSVAPTAGLIKTPQPYQNLSVDQLTTHVMTAINTSNTPPPTADLPSKGV